MRARTLPGRLRLALALGLLCVACMFALAAILLALLPAALVILLLWLARELAAGPDCEWMEDPH
jgi:chromate transport protein ChrA